MSKETTRFSKLFNILFDNSVERYKTAFFNSLLGWINDNYSDQSISQFTTGARELPEVFSGCLSEPNALTHSNEQISNEIVHKIKNISHLKKQLLQLLDTYSVDTTTYAYMQNISETDAASFISYLLYLAITNSNQLPDITNVSKQQDELVSLEEQALLRKNIWTASQQDYFISHREGNRFAALNIIERLLPKGYIEPEIMDFHFNSNNKELKCIDDICDSTNDNISITGEGGIGKTTFLQKVLERTFGTEESPKEYNLDCPIPIFVELNRCPKEIGEWYNDRYQKTNFITRHIADIIQSSVAKYRDYSSLLEIIENEFRTNPFDSPQKYLLLLDGFNEVSTGMSNNGETVRASLSHEISELRKLPNVRIITTSRVTQSAYYANDFTRVHLNGLEENDIRKHLMLCDYSNGLIGQIIANKNLMKCLSVPLFLCMFSYKNDYENTQIPETYGEILFNFFHKNGNFYNLRNRSDEAYNNPYQHVPYVTELILDYIVPYIGWYFVQNDTFSLTRGEFRKCISMGIQEVNKLISDTTYIPLSDFDYDISNIRKAIHSIHFDNNKTENQIIISCIHDYLSIVYEFETKASKDDEQKRYSFIHHHFRDYFSAVWNINIMRLLPYYNTDFTLESIHNSLCEIYWNKTEAETIGQILQEHRNRPIMNIRTKNWELPQPNSEEQQLLLNVLDFCREHNEYDSSAWKVLLQNIINTLNICRGELSGICFDKLDLRECNFHNMTCSKKGATDTLAATFRLSKLSESSFMPLDHLDLVTECLYAGNRCFTIDQSKLIKVWDVLSGNQITHFNINEESEYPDYSTTGFIRVSPDGKQLAAKVQPADPNSEGAYIIIYNLEHYLTDAFKIQLPKKHKLINDFAFTQDSSKLIVVADTKDLYIYHYHDKTVHNSKKIYTLSFRKKIDDLFSHIRIYTCNNNSDFYLYTYDLDLLDIENEYFDDEYDDFDEEYFDDFPNDEDTGTPCAIFKFSLSTKKIRTIYTYTSAPDTTPAFTFIPSCNCFVIYDNKDLQLKMVDCEFEDTTPILQKIMDENDSEMPASMHCANNKGKTVYIMYSYTCYQVEINATGISQVVEKYDSPNIESNSSDFSSNELTFMVNAAPTNNRFLLWNDNHETYEWHIENGEPQYKYNTRMYDTKALIPDNTRKIFILVHAQNGVTIFSQNTLHIVNSYSFAEEDYKIEHAEYSAENGYLFMLFERGQHNFVKYINIDTSESEIVYSEQRPSDGNTKLFLSQDGQHLLITTVQYCDEYSLKSNTLHRIYNAEQNEWLTTAYYVDNTIHIGIAMARDYLKPVFEPRCEIYTRTNDYRYEFQYGYVIPTLDKSLTSDFVHKNSDTGIPCNYKTNFLQSYWITKGFFMNSSPNIQSFLKLRKLIKNNDTIIESGILQLDTFNMIQVMHKTTIDNRETVNGTQNTYSYLSFDYSEAMFIYDYELITYWEKLKEKPASYITFDYKKTPELTQGGSTTWDYAIPINNNHFICCTDSYRLFPVNANTGEFDNEISYTPGLAICGCKFKKAIVTKECMELIKENGGLF